MQLVKANKPLNQDKRDAIRQEIRSYLNELTDEQYAEIFDSKRKEMTPADIRNAVGDMFDTWDSTDKELADNCKYLKGIIGQSEPDDEETYSVMGDKEESMPKLSPKEIDKKLKNM